MSTNPTNNKHLSATTKQKAARAEKAPKPENAHTKQKAARAEKAPKPEKPELPETREKPGKSVTAKPRETQEKLQMVRVWTMVGALILIVAALAVLGKIGSVILFLAVGIIVGFICSPIVNALERRHVPRSAGALIALIVVLGIFTGIIALLGPPATEQLLNLLNRVPAYMREIQKWLAGLFANGTNVSMFGIEANIQTLWSIFADWGTKMASDVAAQITSGIVPNLLDAANSVFMFFLGLICAYWLAADYPTIVKEFSIIAGPKHKKDLLLLLAVTSRSMGGYMRGICITSVVGGLLAFVGFTIVGQPYAPLMGIITALFHFVPVVGPWFSAAIATITAFIVSPVCALWTLIMAIVAENITDNLVSPLVMRSTVKVHPAMSLLAIVVGSALGGAIGIAVSIPISAAIKGVFVYYFETKTGRQIVSYNGALFQGTPYEHKDGTLVASADALDDDNFYATSRLVDAGEGQIDVHAVPCPQSKKRSF